MPTSNDSLYRPASLASYSRLDRWKIRAASSLFYWAIRLIALTVRFETRGVENLDSVERAGLLPIYTVWHDRIFLGTWILRKRGIVVMTSRSFDGEYIARFIQRFGFGASRGSSSRGGAKALVEMIKTMRAGLPTAITVDGPRGPRYKAKAGPVVLAKKTGHPIVPFIVEARSYSTTGSWDQMQIPRPFTRALLILGKPIHVDSSAADDEIAAKTHELQLSLELLVEEGRRWRTGHE